MSGSLGMKRDSLLKLASCSVREVTVLCFTVEFGERVHTEETSQQTYLDYVDTKWKRREYIYF